MIEESIINEHIISFKQDLKLHSSEEIVQRRIISGDSIILEARTYHELRTSIAENFQIHANEVVLVGSAKLGFSIAPYKEYRHFGDSSDLDLAIVSSDLFDKFWKAVYNLWKQKVFWENEHDFKKYLFQGWIRPDKLPNAKSFAMGDSWWEYFRELTKTNKFGPYKITGALYKDWDYLQGYQNYSVQICKDKL